MPLFKITRNQNYDKSFRTVNHQYGSHTMRNVVSNLEGDAVCPSNRTPYKDAANTWAENCIVGQKFRTDNYMIERIS